MMAAVGAGRLEVVRHLVVQHFDGFLSIICQRLEGLFFLFENIGRNMINCITDGSSWDRYANHWQPRSNSDRCGEVLLSFFFNWSFILVKVVEITFSTDCIYRDSHPLLVPVLQKKKCSKSGKKISKERSREISWSVLILYLCICKTQIQLIMLSFQFRLKDDRDIDDLLSFIEGPCSKVTNEKKKKVKKSAK